MKNILKIARIQLPFIFGAVFFATSLSAAEREIVSPGGVLKVIVSDADGLNYRVEVKGQTILTNSPLGLEFKDGTKLGPEATITKSATERHNGQWENPFGNRRSVRDHWRELRLTLQETGPTGRTFGLIVRAYDDGVAFRYDLPTNSGLGQFVLTNELTEFRFADDYRCWAGGESACAENQYPETRLSAIPTGQPGQPYHSVLPLLVETPVGYFAIAESDLLDWSGMSLSGTGTPAVRVVLDGRFDGNGLVASSTPRVSPWRVLMFGRTAADLVGSDLIVALATPSRLKDISWIKPGACAWDAWWTGINPFDSNPQHRAVDARGTTPSDKEYIDLAARMGWPYQLMDWYWYEGMTGYMKSLNSPPNAKLADFRKVVPEVNIPELMAYAKSKNVRLLIWAHSLDVKTFGVDATLKYLSELGFAGVKIDFINSQSQESVEWCENVLATAAKYHLLIDFHGTYKPTGLARTYPNFITQEGVLGNEYNKFGEGVITPQHTVNLAFTRALLGPMDFTPGGFINRAPKDFKITSPTEVMGTRARQLAMTVIYPSPLTVLCDSPTNYFGQPGIEFLRAMPTVWDESVVLSGEVGKSIVIARRSGQRWYLAAMTGNDAAQLQVPLKFLGKGKWTLRAYADDPGSTNYEAVSESTREVTAKTVLPLSLNSGGGFGGIISKAK
ncbi:MAG TPA: glycoside hydrolase family 97 protein [Verrucomicrobiae bacterium]|nr:glycoside hydrolase family 97 protein [Verrucomicrobiae bacterium]